MNKKVLLIGIDGGTWSILKPAMDDGFMPVLNSMVAGGASGILHSTLPAITPAAWGSFQTGCNPGANGVFDFLYFNKKPKTSHFVNSRQLKNSFWDIAGSAGKRVCIINVPMTYPPKPVNGYMVTGILTPSMDSEFTWPREFKKELLAAVPQYHIIRLGKVKLVTTDEQVDEFLQQMIEVVENRKKAAIMLLNKEPFDLFMVHFQAPDIVQHALWDYLDDQSSHFEAAKRRHIFDRFWGLLDKNIADVRQAFAQTAGDNFLTLIISDHGFQSHRARFNLGNWLYQEGFLKLHSQPPKAPWLKKVTRTLRVGKILSYFLSNDISAKWQQSLNLNVSEINWPQTRAYAIGHSNEGFIYLMEEQSSLQQATAAELTAKLMDIHDPQTGTRIIEKIHRKEDIYSGEFMDIMPDLVIEPAAGYSCSGAYQKGAELFHRVRPETDFHMGKHHKDGILVAEGNDIQPQHDISARIIDMAPTILYYLGLAVDPRIEGRVLNNLFRKSGNHQDLLKVSGQMPPVEPTPSTEDVYSREEEKEIAQRLKNLGYM